MPSDWQPDILRLNFAINGVILPHDTEIFDRRVIEWELYAEKHHDFPSILITSSGYVVNGRHRLLAYRNLAKRVKNVRLYGLIVEHNGTDWITTGNLCLVK